MSMPAVRSSDAPGTPAALVARLRAAGCVFAEDEARLLLSAAPDPAALDDMVDRRVAGVPLEYVLGWAEFCGLRIAVDDGVFVPRQRTEFLVREAAELLRATPRCTGRRGRVDRLPVVLDMCCGSGAIGAALAATVGDIELYATDVDPAAVRCARRNVASAGRPGLPGRSLRAAPRDAARPGRHPGGQRAVRAHRGDRHDAARGPPARTAGRPRRRLRTGSTWCVGWPRRPGNGWRRAGICWWRRTSGRRRRLRSRSPATG